MEIRPLTIEARRILKPTKTSKPAEPLEPTTIRKRGRSDARRAAADKRRPADGKRRAVGRAS
jgi:hypothetical protein